MDRKGTNELISGEKSFIAILSNLRVYFVVRLPDYEELSAKTLLKLVRSAAIRVQNPCPQYLFHFYCFRLTRLTFNKS